ncbi:hypothetical protein EST38_g10926 [Candolleomyces aberdarensis]|uniref:Protein kinase domain-containing protein n=1 Tax=Candolleomyces aberdarensis TaxID=2316362 RepID=A0A4Q2D905_9AGAR|nr:hypothetical protein EST38_g10926 [Candolleomyces aberdarensis]
MSSSDCTSSSSTHSNEEKEGLLRDLVAQELGPAISVSNGAWATSLYVGLAPESAIKRFLDDSGEYKHGRWARLSKALARKSQMRESLSGMINSIIRYFSPKGTHAARMAVDARVDSFYREPTRSSTILSSFPDIVIKATGPSFSTPKVATLGFSNIAACVGVGLKEAATDESAQVAEMATYAKHIFIQQPNRNFVRSIAVTGRKVRLFHFDRSGAQYSPPFDIHDDPHTFIRLILGLSSMDERTLGFDDTIQWTIGPDGQKVAGTLRTVGPDNTVVMYDLVMDRGPFTRTSLCGRGTTCWVVRKADGEELIVKDYWVAEDQPSEVVLLDEAKGLPGVCQMVSYEDNRAQTKDFMGEPIALKDNTLKNRTKIRIIMKAYGPSIKKFSSVTQVLSALRDAIAAHKALLDRNIIHRDISPNNILFGLDEGERGVLIDLDLALKSLGPLSEIPVDFRTGTRTFQSLMVLRSYNLNPVFVPEYDYLDDIEAFFWVFAYIVFTYAPNGDHLPFKDHRKLPQWLWNDGSPCLIFARKFTFLDSPSAALDAQDAMHPGWKATCCDLFLEFREFVHEISYEKQRLVYKGWKENRRPAPDRFAPLLAKVDEHYASLLGMFDAALKKAAEAGVDETWSVPLPAPMASSPSPAQSSTSEYVESEYTSADTSATSLHPTATSAEGSVTLLPGKPETPAEQPVTFPRSSKRRYDEAELDDSPVESKRRCPPSRRALRGILGSVYDYCCGWFE